MTAITEPTTAPAIAPVSIPEPPAEVTAILDSADLLRAVKTVKGAVFTGKTGVHVLYNVLLNSPGLGALDVIATDLSTTITVHLDACVLDPFALTVPHKLFADTLPKAGEITLTINNYTRVLTTLETDGTKTDYKGIHADEYPVILPASESPLVAVLPASLVQRAVREIVPFASEDESRPQLSGVWMRVTDTGDVTLAAVDGFRLGRLTGRTVENGPAPVAGEYIIPAKGFALLSVLADQGDTVNMHVNPGRNAAYFVAGRVEVESRLIDGNYVDIQRVIPTDWATRVTVEGDTLSAALKRIVPFTKDSANILRVVADNGVLTLSGTAAEVGGRTVPVPAVGFEGEEHAQVALNIRFVQDIIAPYRGRQIAVELKTYQSPAVLRVVDDPDFLAVIMPMYLPNR